MNTKFQNWSTILKGNKAGEVFLRLSNSETICLVGKPRSVSAYLVKSSVGGSDSRVLHLYTEKKSRNYDGLMVVCKRLIQEYPNAERA